jgi:hypothetical protein
MKSDILEGKGFFMGLSAKAAVISALVGALGMGMIGCEREGPVERAGKQIDDAIERGGEKLEEAGRKVQEKT